MEKACDLVRIVGIDETVAVSVAGIHLQEAVGDELGHLPLHLSLNHAIVFSPDDQGWAPNAREDVSIVQGEQRGEEPLEAFGGAWFA